MGKRRTFEESLELHVRALRLKKDGVPASSIARALGVHHTTILHHLKDRCKCMPSYDGRRYGLDDYIRRELLEIEERAIVLGVKDRRLVDSLCRALIAAGAEPRIARQQHDVYPLQGAYDDGLL